MELFIIIGAIAIISILSLYFAYKNAPEIKEEELPKYQHEVRKVTYVMGIDPYEIEKPKKKKKKYYNKKKKSTIAESATPVAKRPVGRPRKVTE
jgi:hypothetical protein